MRKNKKQLILKFLTEKIMPNYHFFTKWFEPYWGWVKVFCWTGGGILPVWWRVLSQMVSIHCGDGFNTLRDGFNTLRGWFQYTAGMVSLHCGDGFIPTLGWFYPNSGMVLSQLWEGVFFQLWGVFFSKVFFQPKVGFFPTQGGFFSNPRLVFFQPKVGFFPTQGGFFSNPR